MGYKYSGDSVLGVSLTVDAPKPLDIRCVVDTVDDLYTLPEKSSYLGMNVSVISEKTIYMLIDKTLITNENGWEPIGKTTIVEPEETPVPESSEEIITCTAEEYETWKNNTNVDFTPIDESLPYLKEDTYYYIYEDESDQAYLSAAWGKQMEETVSTKASNDALIKTNENLEALKNTVETTYATTEHVNTIIADYATIESVNTLAENVYNKEVVDSTFQTIETANATYSTKEELTALSDSVTENFVTKEMLKGSETEDDDFIFVTQTQYSTDKEAQALKFETDELSADSAVISEINILKIEEKEVELTNDETGEVTTVIESNVVSSTKLTTADDRLLADDKQLAFVEEVPKIEYLSTTDYAAKVENSEIDSETFYCTFDAEDNPANGYITNSLLTEQYYTKQQVDQLIAEEVAKLVARIEVLESLHVVEDDSTEVPDEGTVEEETPTDEPTGTE